MAERILEEGFQLYDLVIVNHEYFSKVKNSCLNGTPFAKPFKPRNSFSISFGDIKGIIYGKAKDIPLYLIWLNYDRINTYSMTKFKIFMRVNKHIPLEWGKYTGKAEVFVPPNYLKII